MTDHTQLRKLAEAAKASAAWYEHYRAYIEAVENPQTVLELLDEIERLKKDAARYRWFRSLTAGVLLKRGGAEFNFPTPKPLSNIMKGSVAQHLDAAIDAAMLK